MNRYQLAKLVHWAGTLRTRKKIQKVVYLLQSAGCPIDADFLLHHFGPYSSDVAALTDEIVILGFLDEKAQGNAAGRQFNYTLTDRAKQALPQAAATPAGRKAEMGMAPFEGRARELLNRDVRELEIAATIVYFRRKRFEWNKAVERACEFKSLEPRSPLVQAAAILARNFLP